MYSQEIIHIYVDQTLNDFFSINPNANKKKSVVDGLRWNVTKSNRMC